jgi:hypothetical protein
MIHSGADWRLSRMLKTAGRDSGQGIESSLSAWHADSTDKLCKSQQLCGLALEGKSHTRTIRRTRILPQILMRAIVSFHQDGHLHSKCMSQTPTTPKWLEPPPDIHRDEQVDL